MSKYRLLRARRRARARSGDSDAGLTLIELLLSMTVTGIVVAAIAMATVVVIRLEDNTRGRSNNARSEQNVGLYMPGDLASAEHVDTSAGALPCGASGEPACPPGVELGGSNAVMLTWSGSAVNGSGVAITTVTHVSYRVIQVGSEFQLVRVECDSAGGGFTCESRVVLHDLEPPPANINFVPGTTTPSWIMTITNALPADDTSEAGDVVSDPGFNKWNAQRVVVTINGGGDAAGAGGGQDQISLSAGGTERKPTLPTSDLAGAPTFLSTRSRCGGYMALVVDTSLSIGSNMSTVRAGVKAYIDAFAGTPVKLEVIAFSDYARGLGTSGSEWTHWYDMLDENDVSSLKDQVDTLSAGGYTNWEDAMFRLLRNADGTVQQTLPGLTVFFTDGEPTKDRLIQRAPGSVAASADPADASLPASTQPYGQVGWNRAERIIRDRGAMRLVGVYVGSLTQTRTWLTPGAGYHYLYERASNLVYEHGSLQSTYERNANVTFQIASTGVTFQQKSGASWLTKTQAQFLAGNTNNTETDGWRIYISGTPGGWTTISETQYDRANVGSGSSDGVRTSVGTLSATWTAITQTQYTMSNTNGTSTDGFRTSSAYGGWATITKAEYDAANTTTDSSDGYRTTYPGSAPSWTSATKAEYDASNTSADETDGWRSQKEYSAPFDFFEGNTSKSIESYALLGNLTIGDTSGTKGTFVEGNLVNGAYTNASVANVFKMADYNYFDDALKSVALGECGGTVTLQTKVGTTAAQDPFTYERSDNHTVVQTSAAYRSGTFDVALPGGTSTVVTIAPQDFTSLTRYQPGSWTCRSAGSDYPFTTATVTGHSPWTSITLTVNPNQAVSCVQTVTFT